MFIRRYVFLNISYIFLNAKVVKLFLVSVSALGKHKENMDETPYVVPDLFTQMNNNVFRNSKLGNSNHAALNNSFTQDDLRLHDSGISSQHSGESYYVNQRVHEPNHR